LGLVCGLTQRAKEEFSERLNSFIKRLRCINHILTYSERSINVYRLFADKRFALNVA